MLVSSNTLCQPGFRTYSHTTSSFIAMKLLLVVLTIALAGAFRSKVQFPLLFL